MANNIRTEAVILEAAGNPASRIRIIRKENKKPILAAKIFGALSMGRFGIPALLPMPFDIRPKGLYFPLVNARNEKSSDRNTGITTWGITTNAPDKRITIEAVSRTSFSFTFSLDTGQINFLIFTDVPSFFNYTSDYLNGRRISLFKTSDLVTSYRKECSGQDPKEGYRFCCSLFTYGQFDDRIWSLGIAVYPEIFLQHIVNLSFSVFGRFFADLLGISC